MSQGVFDRTGASAVLADHKQMAERAGAMQLESAPFLATVARHVSAALDVDTTTGGKVAVALVLTADRAPYIAQFVDKGRLGECERLLTRVEAVMTPAQQQRVRTETALVLGDI